MDLRPVTARHPAGPALLLCSAGIWLWMNAAVVAAPPVEMPGDFYRDLKRKPVATLEDAVRAVARYEGYSGPSDLRKELEFLRSRNITFKKDISKIGNAPVTKGNAVHIFMTAMKYRGGLMRWVMPGSQRIAVREAIHKKILPKDSIATEKMTGGELLAVLTKVVEAKQSHGGGGDGGDG